jgi:hypothetical protein
MNEKKTPDSVAGVSIVPMSPIQEYIAARLFLANATFILAGGNARQASMKALCAAKEFGDCLREYSEGTLDVSNMLNPKPELVPVVYTDVDTGEQVTKMEPKHDIFAPNRPRNDPINQRSRYFLDHGQDGHRQEHPEQYADAVG